MSHQNRVLDIGCGSGESLNSEVWLREADSGDRARVHMVGVDIDVAALRRGKERFPRFSYVCARGEQLPFREESFSSVISWIAMPYMDIPLTLREIARVLRKGGELRAKLYPFVYVWSELTDELRSGSLWRRVQNLIYRLYVIGNGLALNIGGFNFRFPAARRRCESFQTRNGVRRVLMAAGFRNVDTSCWMTAIQRPHAGNCRVRATRGTGGV